MRRFITPVISLGLMFLSSYSSQAAAKVFNKCTELNKVYPGGVGLPAAINSGRTTKKLPMFNKALYVANKKSDREKDGVACEK
jgi:hypothetical protein